MLGGTIAIMMLVALLSFTIIMGYVGLLLKAPLSGTFCLF